MVAHCPWHEHSKDLHQDASQTLRSITAFSHRLHACSRQEEGDGIGQSPDEDTDRLASHLSHFRPLDEPLHQAGDPSVQDYLVEAHGTVVPAQAHDIDQRHHRSAGYVIRIQEEVLPSNRPKNVLGRSGAVHLCIIGLLQLSARMRHNITCCEDVLPTLDLQVLVDLHFLAATQGVGQFSTGHCLRVAFHSHADIDDIGLVHLSILRGAACLCPSLQALVLNQANSFLLEPPFDVHGSGVREGLHERGGAIYQRHSLPRIMASDLGRELRPDGSTT
mmetsp:Transcript_50298/g.106899  ORF Transcript_50298/g.106899 Transcript_50298/m.106899 type:complete len:276 (+) Transcript_50298:878-1705(+)